MKIFKVVIFFDQADGSLHQCDAIQYQGGLWLVPYWLENATERLTMPARIIRIDNLAPQEWGESYVLNYQLSKAVFDGRQKPSQGSPLVVIEAPDIKIPWAPGTH